LNEINLFKEIGYEEYMLGISNEQRVWFFYSFPKKIRKKFIDSLGERAPFRPGALREAVDIALVVSGEDFPRRNRVVADIVLRTFMNPNLSPLFPFPKSEDLTPSYLEKRLESYVGYLYGLVQPTRAELILFGERARMPYFG